MRRLKIRHFHLYKQTYGQNLHLLEIVLTLIFLWFPIYSNSPPLYESLRQISCFSPAWNSYSKIGLLTSGLLSSSAPMLSVLDQSRISRYSFEQHFHTELGDQELILPQAWLGLHVITCGLGERLCSGQC